MRKKTAIIITTLILLLLAGALGYLYLTHVAPTDNSNNDRRSILDYFPFGRNSIENTDRGESTGSDLDDTTLIHQPVPILRKVSALPVAGGTTVDRAATETVGTTTQRTAKTFIRFVDRSTGHIYETPEDSLVVTRLSNTTIPKIHEVVWGENADSLILRYVENDNIRSFAGRLTATSSAQGEMRKFEGSYLSPNITFITSAPAKNRIFYLTSTSQGSVGALSLFNGNSRSQIFNSPLMEWVSSWPTATSLVLSTMPSGSVAGYSYRLSIDGKFEKIIGGINGLTILVNPAFTHALYSESRGGTFNLFSYNIKDGNGVPATTRTLPEKCVWSKKSPTTAYCAVPRVIPQGLYPDNWYQGFISFNDSVWIVDAEGGGAVEIFSLQNHTQEEIDAINLVLNDKEDMLLFMNKKDLSLWALKLPAAQ
jgi:hypothetical protein